MLDDPRLFFARRFYKMNVITIVDFFYNLYAKLIEILAGIAVSLSHFGSIVINLLLLEHPFAYVERAVSINTEIMIGASIIPLRILQK